MRFLADENFKGPIFDQLIKTLPDLDILRVQDLEEIYRASDDVVLEWAAQHHRIVITHDVNTLVGDAYQRIRNGLPMPGVIAVNEKAPSGQSFEALFIYIQSGTEADFE